MVIYKTTNIKNGKFYIGKDELIEVLKENSLVKAGKHFGVSATCIRNKIIYYNISLEEIRNSK